MAIPQPPVPNPHPPLYSWLLFDLDGTLFDFDLAEARALPQTFAHFGLTCEPAHIQIFHRINGNLWRSFERGEISQTRLRVHRFADLLKELNLDADPDRFSELYLQLLSDNSDMIDGAEEVLDALSGRYRMALITNGLLDVQRPRLARSPISYHFDPIIISEEVGGSKPGAHIFDVTFQEMGHPPRDRVLIIGDSLTSDMTGGINYGIDTCWFNPDGREPDPGLAITHEIKDLRDLLQLLT